MVHASPPPGWYPQPENTMRYWDGSAWTDDIHTPPPARPWVYDGIRWLGVRWGRNGNPGLLVASSIIFLVLSAFQFALWGYRSGPIGVAILASLTAAVAVIHGIEAHFAARVVREQQPRTHQRRKRR